MDLSKNLKSKNDLNKSKAMINNPFNKDMNTLSPQASNKSDNKVFVNQNKSNPSLVTKPNFANYENKPLHLISCTNIDKTIKTASYQAKILENVNVTIDEGEIVIILGPSGSGKTTLLNIIAGIDHPTNGQVLVDGIDIHKLNDKNLTKFRREKIAYIYQRYGLIPISTVFDNIKLGQHLVPAEHRTIDFDLVIKKTGLEKMLSKFPHELSGGQKQRVAISRAILKQPKLMLCDEPTGALDEETSKNIIDLFLMVNRDYRTTIVMVTHNNELVSIADKIIYIKDGKVDKVVVNNRK